MSLYFSISYNNFNIVTFIGDGARQFGETFNYHSYPKAGETEPSPKVAYGVNFEPWNVMIGTARTTTESVSELSRQMSDSSHTSSGTIQEQLNETEMLSTAINEMTSTIHEINDMNVQVATATEEQTSVAEEVNRNVTSINTKSHSVMSDMDLVVKNSEELSALSDDLTSVLSKFKV